MKFSAGLIGGVLGLSAISANAQVPVVVMSAPTVDGQLGALNSAAGTMIGGISTLNQQAGAIYGQISSLNQQVGTLNSQLRLNGQTAERQASLLQTTEDKIFDNLDTETKKEDAATSLRQKKQQAAVAIFTGLMLLSAGVPK